MKTKILSFLFLLLTCILTVYGESPSTFSVTIPTSFPIYVDSEGNTSIASDLKISNNGEDDIEITAITVVSENNWNLIESPVNLNKNTVGYKEYSISIQNNQITHTGEYLLANTICIPAFSDLTLNYSIEVSPQCNNVREIIANVIFTLEVVDTYIPPVLYEITNDESMTDTLLPESSNENIPNNDIIQNEKLPEIENDKNIEPIYNLEDFYVYDLDADINVYKLSLNTNFYDALYNQTNYLDWNYGEPLPNPDLNNEYLLDITEYIFGEIDFRILDLTKWDNYLIGILDNLENNKNFDKNPLIKENNNNEMIVDENVENDKEQISDTSFEQTENILENNQKEVDAIVEEI